MPEAAGETGEFELIARYLAPLASGVTGAYGLTDDAAVLSVPPGHELVVTTDAMIESVHFLREDGGRAVARKLLRVNLSDLAAKGAVPMGYQLVLGMPTPLDERWVEAFAEGLAIDQAEFAFPVCGGDTVRSPAGITLAVTAFGLVPTGEMLRRGGARVGDDLYVTGTIGDAALALEARLNKRQFPVADLAYLNSRLTIPTPRLSFGQALRKIAHAAIDVSDGLVQDAGHIADTAGLRLVMDADLVPLSAPAAEALQVVPDLMASILSGGDDYELLFTAPASSAASLAELANATGVAVTRIGRAEAGAGVVVQRNDKVFSVENAGFQHFGKPVK